MKKENVRKELLSFLRKVDGFAYVNVSNIDDILVPIRMHDEEEFSRLKASIESEGILIPLILLKKRGENRYYLVDGRNRLRAAKELGIDEVPALIYSYEGYDYESQRKEAEYLAVLLEQARRHLSEDEIRDLISYSKKFLKVVEDARKKVVKDLAAGLVLDTSKEEKSFSAEVEVDERFNEYERLLEEMKKERAELLKKLEDYEKQIDELNARLEEMEGRGYEDLLDAEYFSVESEDKEKEREAIIRETEQRLMNYYTEKIKEYELTAKELKESLDKKNQEIKVLEEKIKFMQKRTNEIKKTLGTFVSINTLVKKIDVLFEEAKGIESLVNTIVINAISFASEEWQSVMEKWEEFKSYLEYLDKEIKEATVLCNKSSKVIDMINKKQQELF